LFGIVTESRRPPRADSDVFISDRHVGNVTSGNFSPILEQGIALALLQSSCAVGDAVTIRVRDVEIEGRIVERPFIPRNRT
jgi:aminomethyltransferase